MATLAGRPQWTSPRRFAPFAASSRRHTAPIKEKFTRLKIKPSELLLDRRSGAGKGCELPITGSRVDTAREVSRLPKWMTSAKNRNHLLVAIGRLRAKLNA